MMRQRRETEAQREIHGGEELPKVAKLSSSKELPELEAWNWVATVVGHVNLIYSVVVEHENHAKS
jgi:hypothetical protein